MKKFFFVFNLMCLFALGGIAQTKSVDVDNVWFAYAYRSLPTDQLSPTDFKYAVKASATGVAKNYISTEEVANNLLIAGQVKVDNPNEALVVVELSLGNIIVTQNSVSERKEEHKDKNNNVRTTYYYKVVTNYTFESSYVIRKGQEVLRKGIIYSRSDVQMFNSNEYASRKEAADYWNNNKDGLISEFYRALSLKSAQLVSNDASKRYGFTPMTGERDIIKTIDEKKHNENQAFREAVNTLKAELQAMTPDKPMNQEIIDGLITYFKSIPEKYTDPAHKADVRLRYAAWFNLCKIYLHSDQPENVAQYANLITKNGYDAKDGEKLIKAAEELKARFDKTDIRTRHFNPDEYFSRQEE